MMEFVPPETFLWVATDLMPNLTSVHREARRNSRFRSFFGTSTDTCDDLWVLFCSSFHPTDLPAHMLWALMLTKQNNTEEKNSGRASVHGDTVRDWVWCIISAMSNVTSASLNFHDML